MPSSRPAPTRRAVPRPAVPSAGRVDRGDGSAGSTRSLSQRVRGQSSRADLDAARRRLEAERARTTTPKEVTRKDLLDRYRGDRPSRAGTKAQPRSDASKRRDLSTERTGGQPLRRTDAGRGDGIITDVDKSDARRRAAAKRTLGGERDAGRSNDVKTRDGVKTRDDARTTGRAPTKNQRDAAAKRYEDRLKQKIARERRSGGRAGLPGDRVAGRGNSPIEVLPTGTLTNARPDRLAPTGPTSNVGGAWRDRSGFACSGPEYYFNNCYWNTWGGHYGSPWGSWFCSPFLVGGYWWHNCWYTGFYNYGFGWNSRFGWNWGWGGRNAFWYGPSLPLATSIVYYDDPDPEVIYIEVPSDDQVVYQDALPADEAYATAGVAPAGGSGVVPTPAVGGAQPDALDAGLERELGRAASYYLTQGDQAFRESRYGDAVHYYAKAVEFSPESGILYLVLSDALFATGDYRYAAFALKQAMEFDAELFDNVVDKRDFYADAAEFDTQVQVLEGYVDDHLLDMDARLVLASNYLFGGRPGAAIDLIQNPFSEELRGSDEGKLLLRVARETLGFPAPDTAPEPSTVEIRGDDNGPL